MRKSRIFTNRELQEITIFQDGNRKDKNGIFCSKVRPKIKELFDVWFPKKKELQQLIRPKQKCPEHPKTDGLLCGLCNKIRGEKK